MQLGREIDIRIAEEIFGCKVFLKQEVLHEKTESGERPLPKYSQDMQAAWSVADQMRVSLIPVENNNWFAFVGPQEGWTSPDAFLQFLKNGDFTFSGASVGESAALVICEAALVANQKRKAEAETGTVGASEVVQAADRFSGKSKTESSEDGTPPVIH